MWPNPQETADLVVFTEEILNGKLQFLCYGARDISVKHRVFKVLYSNKWANKKCTKFTKKMFNMFKIFKVIEKEIMSSAIVAF